ncbi:MAG: phosphodiesterase [Actinobacteria bacterium]|nr:phosphodiesterase [Actinomycetota bacterium]
MNLPPDLLRPGGPSVRSVLAAAIDATGMERIGGEWPHGRHVLGLPAARRACVVLVDGLGHTQLTERSGHFPFLRTMLRDCSLLETVVPSTTAAAITSIGTGLNPGATGMLGYTVREPRSGELLNMIKWDQGLVTPEDWQRRDTLAQRLASPVRFASVGPGRFVGSGLNRAAFRGARDVSAEDLADRVDVTVAELRSGTADVVYLYWGEVDHVGHVSGWGSWEWGEEASRTDRELRRLAAMLPRDTLLVITADHGMVDVAESIDAARVPELVRGVDLISGEPRAMHVHTTEDGVLDRWREHLGDRAWILPRAEALALYPDLDPRFVRAIGDVVVFMRGRTVVVDSRTQTPASMALIGVHGSLTPEEMLVPLMVTVT